MSANFTPEKEDLKILTPFKMQVLTNFPYIEADFDALTNYQLLCKIVEYLKENDLVKVGDEVKAGDVLAVFYGNDEAKVDAAVAMAAEAFTISSQPVDCPALDYGYRKHLFSLGVEIQNTIYR